MQVITSTARNNSEYQQFLQVPQQCIRLHNPLRNIQEVMQCLTCLFLWQLLKQHLQEINYFLFYNHRFFPSNKLHISRQYTQFLHIITALQRSSNPELLNKNRGEHLALFAKDSLAPIPLSCRQWAAHGTSKDTRDPAHQSRSWCRLPARQLYSGGIWAHWWWQLWSSHDAYSSMTGRRSLCLRDVAKMTFNVAFLIFFSALL